MNPNSNQAYRVLVVDDEKNIRLMLRNALETDGYEVIEAENGKQALDELEQFRPDVVLLDLSMPVMDGMRFLGELRELDAADRPAVVVLTAYGSISAAVQAMKLGAVEFIEKPSTPDDIRTAVEQAIVEQAMKPEGDELKAPTYDETLLLIHEALRTGEMKTVEALLLRAGSIAPDDDAEFFNLAGIFHEASGRSRVARKFYGRAIRVNPNYEPAQQNMRRLFEFDRFGHSDIPAALGDELQFVSEEIMDIAKRPSLLERIKHLFGAEHRAHGKP